RLAREVEADAEALGMQTVFGRFIEDGQTPFLAFASAFVPQCERARLLDDGSPLGPLALHLRRIAGLPAEAPGNAEAGAGAGLPLALGRAALLLARRRPLLLVLDDLHWAEAASVDLFAHLVRAIADAAEREPARICILAIMRPPEPDGHLQRTLERLRREPVVSELALGGMDELELNELVAGHAGAACSPPLLGALQRAARGNPLFALELVDHLETSGALTREHGRLASAVDPEVLPLPREVTRAIADRVAALPGALRQALTAAALSGDELTVEHFAVVAGLSEDAALDLADAAVSARLFVDTGESYRFAHPVIRHVLQEQATSSRRPRLHGQIAQRLLAAYGDGDEYVMELAGHLLLAGDRSPASGPLFRRGADSAFARLSWLRAAELRERALECQGYADSLPVRERAELFRLAGVAHYRAMDVATAAERFERAIEGFRAAGDTEGWGAALDGRIRIEVSHTSFQPPDRRVLGLFRDFEAAVGPADPAIRKTLPIWAELLYRLQDSEQESVAQRALDLGNAAEDRLVVFHSTFALGLAAAARLDWHTAAIRYREVLDLAAGLGDPWYRAWGLQNLPVALGGVGRVEEALAAAETAAEYARGLGDWAIVATASAWKGDLAAALGKFDEVERCAAAAYRGLQRSEFAWAGPPLYSGLAWSRAQRGQAAAARDAVDALERIVGRRMTTDLRVLVCALTDGPAVAVREIEILGARLDWLPALNNGNLWIIAIRAQVAVAARSEPLARGVLPLIEEAIARGVEFAPNPGMSLIALRALLRALIGNVTETELQEATTHARLSGAYPDLVRLLLLSERLGHPSGESVGSEALAIGREIGLGEAFFHCYGSPWLAAEMRGGAPHDDLRFECLCEMALGLDDAAIAEKLLVSEATVRAMRARLSAEFGSNPLAVPARDPRLAFAQAAAEAGPLGHAGPLAFLFSDLVDSTPINTAVGDAAWAAFLADHHRAMRQLAEGTGGQLVSTEGDGTFAAFTSVDEALECARGIHAGMAALGGWPIRARVGIHLGDAVSYRDAAGTVDYFGVNVTTAARICQSAGASETLVSEAARAAVSDTPSGRFEARGLFALKGLDDRVRVYAVASATSAV
ncbi:MAG: adenylate/guanylate cyclase domain-containing protein, partial [Dehalococcoidia bacterium]